MLPAGDERVCVREGAVHTRVCLGMLEYASSIIYSEYNILRVCFAYAPSMEQNVRRPCVFALWSIGCGVLGGGKTRAD